MTKIKQLIATAKVRWKTPAPGETTTLKEFFAYCFGVMGICGFTFICSETVSFASGYFCGAIMGIKLIDFTIISFISLAVKYITLAVESISMEIFENKGMLPPKKKKKAIAWYCACIVVGIACYFVPSSLFESLMKGLPGIVGNSFLIMGAGGLVNWFLRKKLCPKYGQYKPFMVIYGIPITLITCAMVFVPSTLEYSIKIVLLHFLTTLRSRFTSCYSDSPTSIVGLVSSNMVERQKYYSFGAIFLGLFRSIFRIIFPILIVYTGGYFSIRSYQIFIPIFAVLSLLMGFVFIGVKERFADKEAGVTRKIDFKKSAKTLLKNKYFWIMNISSTLQLWTGLADGIISYIFIYQMRLSWITGLISIFGVTSVAGNLLTPSLIKRYEKRTCILIMRLILLVVIGSHYIALELNSVVLFIILLFIRGAVAAACNNIINNMSADILDYHQWKTGERADNMRNIFGWFTTPISTLLGFVSPWILAKFGYTSDWDILFDPNIFYNIMRVYVILSVASLVLSTLPYCFYDLKKADLARYVKEIAERQKDEKEGTADADAPENTAVACADASADGASAAVEPASDVCAPKKAPITTMSRTVIGKIAKVGR